jgi:hypothetical protein
MLPHRDVSINLSSQRNVYILQSFPNIEMLGKIETKEFQSLMENEKKALEFIVKAEYVMNLHVLRINLSPNQRVKIFSSMRSISQCVTYYSTHYTRASARRDSTYIKFNNPYDSGIYLPLAFIEY